MNLMGLLRRRSSAHAFAESAISDAELRHLAQAASLAPSAFRLQNWRFTAVCSFEAKQALCEAAFRQPKILQAAAVFIISGDLLGYQALAARLQPVVAAGQMDQATADGWAAFAQSAFHENPNARRSQFSGIKRLMAADAQSGVRLHRTLRTAASSVASKSQAATVRQPRARRAATSHASAPR